MVTTYGQPHCVFPRFPRNELHEHCRVWKPSPVQPPLGQLRDLHWMVSKHLDHFDHCVQPPFATQGLSLQFGMLLHETRLLLKVIEQKVFAQKGKNILLIITIE